MISNIMKKSLLYLILILVFLTGCTKEEKVDGIEPLKNIYEEESDIVSNINVVINGEKYILNLEDNETAEEFTKLLPKTYTMSELNGNEKYVYLDSSLPTNSLVPDKINKGDVYLFGDDCLVIFYKSFTTNYSYTKIGHIDNLPELDKSEIKVSFS